MRDEYLFGIWMMLNIMDSFLTDQILQRGGQELNAVMRWLFGKLGRVQTLVLKVVWAGAIGMVALASGHAQLILVALCIGYTGVVLWNMVQLMRY